MVNPFTMLRIYSRMSRVLGLVRAASASYEKEKSMSKSLFASKAFWLNFLTASVEVTGALSGIIPPGALTLVLAGLNVGVRILTRGPVHVLQAAAASDDE